MDSGSAPHRFESPVDYFCVQYFEQMDLLLGEITLRFDQTSLSLPLAVEKLLLSSTNSSGGDDNLVAVPQIVVDAYSSDVNIKKLERQIEMLPDLVNVYTAEQNVKQVFRV